LKLQEYQAKRIFGQFGVPVPQGDVATTPAEARAIAERIGGTVVIKSQVLVGGRGKAGGIKLARSPQEAEEVAGRILGMDIKGLKVKKVLVVISHMDSPRAPFYHHPALLWSLRIAFILDFVCMTALFMLFTVTFAGHLLSMEEATLDFLWHLGLIVATVPALVALALFVKACGGSTPGGNDNATGVTVLLELARVYTRRQPYNTDLWLISTGAADAGGAGLKKLLRHHRRELKGAYFIVMDGVGRGFPVCYRREGRLIAFRGNRRLAGVVKDVSGAHGHYSVGFRRNGLYLGECFQLLSRGRKAITVSSREESHYPRYWRCSKDDYDNIDLRSLRLSLDFMIALVDTIDRGDLK